MTVSAIICGRNDNYGGHLIERATYSIYSMLDTFDEVIYVDWNTESGKKILKCNFESAIVKRIPVGPEPTIFKFRQLFIKY